MALGLLLCSSVIVLCILTNRFLKRFGIPAVLIFIALGMLFGSEGIVKIPFDNYKMAETICCTALVFIMFYGGFGTSFKEARPILPQSVLLATGGVLITAGVTGLFCHYIVGMNLQESLLVGAVLSSTDAASVFSILRSKKLNLKEGTASLLEVESGSNDPFAYMLTIIILDWMAGSGENILLLVVKEIGFGIIFGGALGWAAVKILKKTDLETGGISTILMIAFVMFSYAAPVLAGGNGYLSVYLFGFIVGNARYKTKIPLIQFFDSIDRLAQMLIFFLLGLLVFPSTLLPILGTAFLIFLGLTFYRKTGGGIPADDAVPRLVAPAGADRLLQSQRRRIRCICHYRRSQSGIQRIRCIQYRLLRRRYLCGISGASSSFCRRKAGYDR